MSKLNRKKRKIHIDQELPLGIENIHRPKKVKKCDIAKIAKRASIFATKYHNLLEKGISETAANFVRLSKKEDHVTDKKTSYNAIEQIKLGIVSKELKDLITEGNITKRERFTSKNYRQLREEADRRFGSLTATENIISRLLTDNNINAKAHWVVNKSLVDFAISREDGKIIYLYVNDYEKNQVFNTNSEVLVIKLSEIKNDIRKVWSRICSKLWLSESELSKLDEKKYALSKVVIKKESHKLKKNKKDQLYSKISRKKRNLLKKCKYKKIRCAISLSNNSTSNVMHPDITETLHRQPMTEKNIGTSSFSSTERILPGVIGLVEKKAVGLNLTTCEMQGTGKTVTISSLNNDYATLWASSHTIHI